MLSDPMFKFEQKQKKKDKLELMLDLFIIQGLPGTFIPLLKAIREPFSKVEAIDPNRFLFYVGDIV